MRTFYQYDDSDEIIAKVVGVKTPIIINQFEPEKGAEDLHGRGYNSATKEVFYIRKTAQGISIKNSGKVERDRGKPEFIVNLKREK